MVGTVRGKAAFDAIVADWMNAGARVKGKTRAPRCIYPGCKALPFADLITSRGDEAICLAHFTPTPRTPRRREA